MKGHFRWTIRGIFLAGIVAAGVWWLRPAPTVDLATSPNRNDNGIWLRRHWLHGGHGSVDTLVREANTLGIRRLYPFLGPMDPSGHPGWRDGDTIQTYTEDQVQAFFSAVHTADPDLAVMPWTGGVYQRDVVLSAAHQQAAFAGHMQRLVHLGADGVHINVEPLPNGHPDFLTLLSTVKAAIGPEAVLSVAAYPPTTHLHPFDDVHWDMDYTRAVCLEADELVVMAYDTALQSQRVYESLVATWVGQYLDHLPPPEAGGCTILFGVPAYEDDEPWHNPEVETMATGLAGVLRGLDGRTVPDHFRGVAVYASWTTDPEEWATYDQTWRGQPPTGAQVTEETGG